MQTKEVLNNVLELGYINYTSDKVNKRVPVLIPPKFSVHKDRVPHFLQYFIALFIVASWSPKLSFYS